MLNIRKIFAAGMIGLFLGGCAAKSSRFVTADEVSEHLIKQTPSTVERALGKPRSIESVGQNRWVWTYHSDMIQNKKATQGKCELKITFEGDKAVNAEVDATEFSPFAAPLATCNLMLDKL